MLPEISIPLQPFPGNSFAADESNWLDTSRWINWDGAASSFTISNVNAGTSMSGASPDYKTVGIGDLTGQVSDDLKKLAIGPVSGGAAAYGNDLIWATNFNTRFSARSGAFVYGTAAGIFAFRISYERTVAGGQVGFRSALVL